MTELLLDELGRRKRWLRLVINLCWQKPPNPTIDENLTAICWMKGTKP